jgi:hypothetical protein
MTKFVDSHPLTYGRAVAVGEFRALCLAAFLSFIGDVALVVLVFACTGSAALTGPTYALIYLPVVVRAPAVTVTTDIARAVVLGAAALVVVFMFTRRRAARVGEEPSHRDHGGRGNVCAVRAVPGRAVQQSPPMAGMPEQCGLVA